ncbi:MAG: hypothetical protein R3268_12860, partial [Acidiferrobacterales bacterium]|nr:hypothetical protein [Acidiferrobacterales bacterium]
TITIPAHNANDVGFVAWYNSRDDQADQLEFPGDWTSVRNDRSSASYDDQTGLGWKALDGVESSLTLTYNGGLNSVNCAMLMIFRGLDTDNCIDGTALEDDGDGDGNDSTPDNPAITTNTDNGVLILYHMPEVNETYTAHGAPATPSGMSTPIEVQAPTTDANQIIGSYLEDYGPAGTITPTDWTHTFSGGGFNGYRLYTVALRLPQSGGTVVPMRNPQRNRRKRSKWMMREMIVSAGGILMPRPGLVLP